VNCLGDEVAGVLTVRLVDRGFNIQSCQSKDYFSAEHSALIVKANTVWFGVRLMCSRLVDFCFMEHYKFNLV